MRTRPVPDPDPHQPSRRPFQFSLGCLLLVTTMVAVLAAALAGMWRAHHGDLAVNPEVFRLMAIAAPLAVLMVVSLIYSLVKRLR